MSAALPAEESEFGDNPRVNEPSRPPSFAGIDFGATLVKAIVVPVSGNVAEMETWIGPPSNPEDLERFLAGRDPGAVGAVGGGARRYAARAASRRIVRVVDEFGAWGAGEKLLLKAAPFVPTTPHLLVSLGTGTSILRIGPDHVDRVGGTALGGGTLRGLGRLLLGEDDHVTLVDLARKGDRRRVDLLVGDLYEPGEISLNADLTAANFGKVSSPSREDVANALVGLLGENVALLAGSIAASLAPGERIDVVYGGSTLIGHDVLRGILEFVTSLAGARARFLPNGEFAGAVGAWFLAREHPDAGEVRA